MHACRCSLEEPRAALKSPGSWTPSTLHVTWFAADFNIGHSKPRVSHSSVLVMRFIYHQPWNNHARFIFPELRSFKRLTAGSFGQLQSRISVTQHIASNCMCQRERSDGGNKSGAQVALGRWCCCFSGSKTKSLADNTGRFRVENLPLPSPGFIASNATASIMLQLQKSEERSQKYLM